MFCHVKVRRNRYVLLVLVHSFHRLLHEDPQRQKLLILDCISSVYCFLVPPVTILRLFSVNLLTNDVNFQQTLQRAAFWHAVSSKIVFRWGPPPDSAGGAYDAPQTRVVHGLGWPMGWVGSTTEKVLKIWNDYVNVFKARLDKIWFHQAVKFHFYGQSDRYGKPISSVYKNTSPPNCKLHC